MVFGWNQRIHGQFPRNYFHLTEKGQCLRKYGEEETQHGPPVEGRDGVPGRQGTFPFGMTGKHPTAGSSMENLAPAHSFYQEGLTGIWPCRKLSTVCYLNTCHLLSDHTDGEHVTGKGEK